MILYVVLMLIEDIEVQVFVSLIPKQLDLPASQHMADVRDLPMVAK